MKPIKSYFFPDQSKILVISQGLAAFAAIVAAAALPCRADNVPAAAGADPTSPSDDCGYFGDWFSRVSKTQAEQPHWITPLVTVTPRLEEELRYDQMWESGPGRNTLTSYGGGKGLELIPAEPIEVIIGLPAWQTENTPHTDGWTDQSFLLKYRLLSANEQEGDYIVTAFMGLSVPDGNDNVSEHHFIYTPTIAAGKGWGDFDIQSTFGVSVPDNGGEKTGAGTPLLSNTTFQYHVIKYVWPEVEANYTYWPNGKHQDLSQLFVTPGLLIGRIHLTWRLGLTFGVGCQFAVTENPRYDKNVILTARLPF